ncbi:hypothetical protein ABVT39_013954 [Epinephelus coioides]
MKGPADNPNKRKKTDSASDTQDLLSSEFSVLESINKKLEVLGMLHQEIKDLKVSLEFTYQQISDLQQNNAELRSTLAAVTTMDNLEASDPGQDTEGEETLEQQEGAALSPSEHNLSRPSIRRNRSRSPNSSLNEKLMEYITKEAEPKEVAPKTESELFLLSLATSGL